MKARKQTARLLFEVGMTWGSSNLGSLSIKRRLQTEINPLPEVVGKNVQEAYLLPY